MFEISKSFQSNKAAGYEKIPMSIINIISEPLAHIIDLFSFATRAGSPRKRWPITVGPYYLTHSVNL